MSLANTIIYGDKFAVAQLLQQGADYDEVDEYGFRPLIEATICDKPEIAELLIQQGAYIDQEDATGRTPLHWAVENASLPLIKLFLQHRADPNHYTTASQPILTMPILRQQTAVKNLLYDQGADLNFALDYINTKLLSHRFALKGDTDIVDPKGRFIAVSMEGFFLEVTLAMITQSLSNYRNHFSARGMRRYFGYLQPIIAAFERALQLIKLQHYLVEQVDYQPQIKSLLNHELLILPIAYRGHAITFIRLGNLWAKCDRGANSIQEGSINIYRITQPQQLNLATLQRLLYQRQTPEFIEQGFKQWLGLTWMTGLPLSPQITGNCSWSNIEAAVPTLLCLLMAQSEKGDLRQAMQQGLYVYQQWLEWDKDRALHECIQSFAMASPARKAAKAALLGAILLQSCQYRRASDAKRAEKILPLLSQKDYRYVVDSYIDIYWRRRKTLPGENLMRLLDDFGWQVQ